MAIARTAAQLVQMVREFAQTTDPGTYRDGFSDDVDTSSTLISILAFVNRSLRIFAMKGYNQGTSTQDTVSGQHNYTLPSGGAGKIVEVLFGSPPIMRPLAETTLQDLAARDLYWRNTQGSPAVYVTLGPDIWLYPVPPWARTLSIRYYEVQEDLVNRTDVPVLLPYYHDGIAHLAAMYMLASDAENPSNMARLNFLLGIWEMIYADVDAVVRARSLLLPRSRIEGGRVGTDQEI